MFLRVFLVFWPTATCCQTSDATGLLKTADFWNRLVGYVFDVVFVKTRTKRTKLGVFRCNGQNWPKWPFLDRAEKVAHFGPILAASLSPKTPSPSEVQMHVSQRASCTSTTQTWVGGIHINICWYDMTCVTYMSCVPNGHTSPKSPKMTFFETQKHVFFWIGQNQKSFAGVSKKDVFWRARDSKMDLKKKICHPVPNLKLTMFFRDPFFGRFLAVFDGHGVRFSEFWKPKISGFERAWFLKFFSKMGFRGHSVLFRPEFGNRPSRTYYCKIGHTEKSWPNSPKWTQNWPPGGVHGNLR